VEDQEELKDEPGRGRPGKQDLASQQQRLPDDQRDHAQIHRAADVPVGPLGDEALRRRPGRRGAAALEREARSRLQNEQRADREQDSAADSQRKRLSIRLPAGQQPRDEPADDRGPTEEDEADTAGCRPKPGTRR
jgi:hypothetical protein